MVEVELKSKELTEYVYLALNKDRSTPLYDDDLEQIKDVTLDALDFLDEPTDETIFDLVFFKNIKSCLIANMSISESEIDILNKLEAIESIQFTNCIFPKSKKVSMGAEYLIFDNCVEVNLLNFDEMKKVTKLRIVNCDRVSLNGLGNLSKINQLYLQNLDLNDIDEVEKLSNIEYINLNGTKVKKLTDVLKRPNIKVDHEENNYIYDE